VMYALYWTYLNTRSVEHINTGLCDHISHADIPENFLAA
jgi:hypothetical protein